MIDTHYYQWSEANKVKDHNTILTRAAYLDSVGYDNVHHKLTEQQIRGLRFILDHHFDKTVKPTL